MKTETRPKHIVILLEDFPYPQDSRVRNQARSLTDAGFAVSVICPSGKDQPPHEILDGVHVYRYPAPKTWSGALSYFWEYSYSMLAMFAITMWIFISRGFDAIHASNPPDTLFLIGVIYKLLGRRYIFDHHDLSPEIYEVRFSADGGNRTVYKTLVFCEKLSCRFADHIFATNESYKQLEIERSGVSENRITVVRNGPDLNFMKLSEPDAELRRRANTIIGYVGVLGFQDGLDYLLRAVKHLVEDLNEKDVLCVIIGRGDALSGLKVLAKELGIEKYVLFTGWLSGERLVRHLSTADICVVPDPANDYINRSTMVKVMEYMALEKPVVAFDSHEQRVTAQGAALYAQPNDELDFAKKIKELINNPDKRKNMGHIGRSRVEEQLAWSHQAKRLIETYHQLFNN